MQPLDAHDAVEREVIPADATIDDGFGRPVELPSYCSRPRERRHARIVVTLLADRRGQFVEGDGNLRILHCATLLRGHRLDYRTGNSGSETRTVPYRERAR